MQTTFAFVRGFGSRDVLFGIPSEIDLVEKDCGLGLGLDESQIFVRISTSMTTRSKLKHRSSRRTTRSGRPTVARRQSSPVFSRTLT